MQYLTFNIEENTNCYNWHKNKTIEVSSEIKKEGLEIFNTHKGIVEGVGAEAYSWMAERAIKKKMLKRQT